MAPRLLDNSVRYAQRGAAGLMIGLTVLCFAQSYRQLIDFATLHGEPRPWNWAWPGMLDGFTLLGELLLFAAVVQRWKRYALALGAALAAAGFGASLAANVGYLPRADAVSRIASAAAPTGAAVALCAALLMLEYQVRARAAETEAQRTEAERAAERDAAQRREDREAQREAQREAHREALQLLAAQRELAEAQRAPQRTALHLVPRDGAARTAERDAGPAADAARSAVREALQHGGSLPSQRELGRVEHEGVRVGVRLAKRILEEFEGDVAAAAHSG